MFHQTRDRRRPHTANAVGRSAALAGALLLALGLVPAVAGAQSSSDTIVYDTTACGWSPGIKESAGVEYKCAGNTVMTGIKHSGDENGDSEYQCCSMDPQNVSKAACAWSDPIKEANSSYTCSSGQALTGRVHSGDENGSTKYYCCNLNNPAGQVLPDDTTCYWSDSQKQSKSDLQCKAGEVMRGRSHQGDENGSTSIYCCKFHGNG